MLTIYCRLQRHYLKGSADRKGIEAAIAAMKKGMPYKIPIVVDGKPVSGSSLPAPYSTYLLSTRR